MYSIVTFYFLIFNISLSQNAIVITTVTLVQRSFKLENNASIILTINKFVYNHVHDKNIMLTFEYFFFHFILESFTPNKMASVNTG